MLRHFIGPRKNGHLAFGWHPGGRAFLAYRFFSMPLGSLARRPFRLTFVCKIGKGIRQGCLSQRGVVPWLFLLFETTQFGSSQSLDCAASYCLSWTSLLYPQGSLRAGDPGPPLVARKMSPTSGQLVRR